MLNYAQRVFDLWHGTVLSKSGALQLLLIVDEVGECARKEYRESILQCLTGGREGVSRSTSPIGSVFSSQFSEADITPHWRSRSLLLRASQGSDARDFTTPGRDFRYDLADGGGGDNDDNESNATKYMTPQESIVSPFSLAHDDHSWMC